MQESSQFDLMCEWVCTNQLTVLKATMAAVQQAILPASRPLACLGHSLPQPLLSSRKELII